MRKRDYKLVRDGKYNKVAIMQQAWAYARWYRWGYGYALKEAWEDARQKMRVFIWEERQRLSAENNLPEEKEFQPGPEADYGYNRGAHAGFFSGWGYNYTGD